MIQIGHNYGLARFRLATPIKPNKPLPNNHTAAGTGTALTTVEDVYADLEELSSTPSENALTSK